MRYGILIISLVEVKESKYGNTEVVYDVIYPEESIVNRCRVWTHENWAISMGKINIFNVLRKINIQHEFWEKKEEGKFELTCGDSIVIIDCVNKIDKAIKNKLSFMFSNLIEVHKGIKVLGGKA